jgi:hypothetical protein
MKKRAILMISIVMVCCGILRADTIFLKNGQTFSGKILRVTDANVEYDPDGPIPFDFVERENVLKLVYSNGRVVKMPSEKNSSAGLPVPSSESPVLSGKGDRTEQYRAPDDSGVKMKLYDSNSVQVYFYPSLLLGGFIDSDFSKWARRRSRQYLSDLQSSDPIYSNYTMQYKTDSKVQKNDTRSASYLGFGVGVAADIYFGFIGAGVAVHCLGDVSSSDHDERVIRDRNGNNAYEITMKLFYYDYSATYYYRAPIFEDSSSKVYIRLGVGGDRSRTLYKYKPVVYRQSGHAPLYDDYFFNCHVTRYGWHVSSSMMADIGPMMLNMGLTYRHFFKNTAEASGTTKGLDGYKFKSAGEFSADCSGGIRIDFGI